MQSKECFAWNLIAGETTHRRPSCCGALCVRKRGLRPLIGPALHFMRAPWLDTLLPLAR